MKTSYFPLRVSLFFLFVSVCLTSSLVAQESTEETQQRRSQLLERFESSSSPAERRAILQELVELKREEDRPEPQTPHYTGWGFLDSIIHTVSGWFGGNEEAVGVAVDPDSDPLPSSQDLDRIAGSLPGGTALGLGAWLNQDGEMSEQDINRLIDWAEEDGVTDEERTALKEIRDLYGDVISRPSRDALDAAIGSDPSSSTPQVRDVADSATRLVEERGDNYGVPNPWYNEDPNHSLPHGVQLGGLEGSWKCNLFAGNSLYNAGFEPPRYGNSGTGEYPNANQWWKWSDAHAGDYNNKSHFEMVGELDPNEYSWLERKEKVQALLAQAQPGDIIIVDHPGDAFADGGHCRVVTANNIGNASGTISNAQASYDSAIIEDEKVEDFTGEEMIWILRPNRLLEGN